MCCHLDIKYAVEEHPTVPCNSNVFISITFKIVKKHFKWTNLLYAIKNNLACIIFQLAFINVLYMFITSLVFTFKYSLIIVFEAGSLAFLHNYFQFIRIIEHWFLITH